MNIADYITVDPNICHGKPCFRGTRIMVYLVLGMLAAGEKPEHIIKDAYPQLTQKHIQAALQFAAEMLNFREEFSDLSAHAAQTTH